MTLSEKYQARLDKWKGRNTEKEEPKPTKIRTARLRGKDYGDVASLEEWNEEAKRSQERK